MRDPDASIIVQQKGDKDLSPSGAGLGVWVLAELQDAA